MTDAPPPVGYPLGPEHRKKFKAFMRHWQHRLGLTRWRIEYSPKKTTYMSEVEFTDDACLAAYRLPSKWKTEEPTDLNLERTAYHECGHVLLRRLIMVAAEKGIDHVDTEAAEHEVINALEKEFFPHIDEKE
jgi:hypothetical protein